MASLFAAVHFKNRYFSLQVLSCSKKKNKPNARIARDPQAKDMFHLLPYFTNIALCAEVQIHIKH